MLMKDEKYLIEADVSFQINSTQTLLYRFHVYANGLRIWNQDNTKYIIFKQVR